MSYIYAYRLAFPTVPAKAWAWRRISPLQNFTFMVYQDEVRHLVETSDTCAPKACVPQCVSLNSLSTCIKFASSADVTRYAIKLEGRPSCIHPLRDFGSGLCLLQGQHSSTIGNVSNRRKVRWVNWITKVFDHTYIAPSLRCCWADNDTS